jgi:CBS domain-containing protein
MPDLSLYTVQHDDTIRTAMEKIEANHHRVVVVLDGGKVVGTVSDGDVRRAFLHDVLPIGPVSRIMQLNPRVTVEADVAKRREQMACEHVTVLPVVDAENRLLAVELAYEPDFGTDEC